MKSNHFSTSLLALAVAAVISLAAVAPADAQSLADRRAAREAERASNKGGKAAEAKALYPDSTRNVPAGKTSSKQSKTLQEAVKAYDAEDHAKVRQLADTVLASADSNAYDKAFAAQLASTAAYASDDNAAAQVYLKQAIELDALDNNGHFQAMYMLAQLQLQDDKFSESLATIDRYLSESKSSRPEDLVVKANDLYRLERYKEAIPLLEQATKAAPEHADWNQLLMAAYAEAGQGAEATKMAEGIAAKTPDDKRAQMNLASVYMQAEQYDKAAAVLEKLRSAGQLTEDKEYRTLYSVYLNSEGKEKQAAGVINEGIQKGVLKPDYQAYIALAQSYYFSDDVPNAIPAYQKAAPLAPDGETYLNLAKILWQEGRVPEAKVAAKAAVAKGLKKPADAQKIIALP